MPKETAIEAWSTPDASRTSATPLRLSQRPRPLGLEGDEQADLTVHGGLAKAVYAYPIEHYAFWREHRSGRGQTTELPYGSLGENLTLSGVLEASLYVGDELRFPDCVLRVTQPRGPCYKLNAAMDDPTVVRTMAQSGYCGFYLAVDVPGSSQPARCSRSSRVRARRR